MTPMEKKTETDQATSEKKFKKCIICGRKNEPGWQMKENSLCDYCLFSHALLSLFLLIEDPLLKKVLKEAAYQLSQLTEPESTEQSH